MKSNRLALLSLILACGGGQTETGPTAPADNNPPSSTPASQTATVNMESTRTSDGYSETDSHTFAPPLVTIRRGGTVTWVNSSGFQHSVSFHAKTGAPSPIGPFEAGQRSAQFNSTGNFQYDCSLHYGMSGEVAVVN